MVISLILNVLNVLLVAFSVLFELKNAQPKRALFRFFTTLSNLFCAGASLLIAILVPLGPLPLWALLIKYAAAAAVTVTMLTVVLYLGPVTRDWKLLLTKDELFLHLICPLLAIVSFLAFEKTALPAWAIAIGALPVPLYGVLYMKKVVYTPEPRRWDDFYGFNRTGKWQLSFALMTVGGALVALLLWLI